MTDPGSPEAPASRPSRRHLFRVAAVLLGLLPFLVLEGVLRLFDVARPARAADTLSGFNRNFPLFERAGAEFRTLRSREPFFNPQRFLAEKPANGFRVFCFGGSTVYGHPYQWETSFPEWLRLELAASSPARTVEVVNCGGVSYASYRLLPVVEETLLHQPDLMVLAMGHNEFLEDRTYQPLKRRSSVTRWVQDAALSLRTLALARKAVGSVTGGGRPATPATSATAASAEVNARLDDARTGYASYQRDDEWHAQVVEQFRDAFEAMIRRCQAAGVPVVVVALGSNLRDCPPFKSEHRTGLSGNEELRWQVEFDEGTRLEGKDPEAALEHYRAAEAIDPHHALGLYRLARCLDRLGEFAEAKEYYRAAKDEDICPLRMTEAIRRAQYEIAAEHGVPVIDAQDLVEARSPEGIPGNDRYLDHVHPGLDTHQQIARGVMDEMIHAGLWRDAAISDEARRRMNAAHLSSLAANYMPNAMRRVEWLDNWSRRQKFHDETLPVDARGHLHAGFRFTDLGDMTKAWESMDTALKLKPTLAADALARGKELAAQGRTREAGDFLDQLLVRKLPAPVRAEAVAAVDELKGR